MFLCTLLPIHAAASLPAAVAAAAAAACCLAAMSASVCGAHLYGIAALYPRALYSCAFTRSASHYNVDDNIKEHHIYYLLSHSS